MVNFREFDDFYGFVYILHFRSVLKAWNLSFIIVYILKLENANLRQVGVEIRIILRVSTSYVVSLDFIIAIFKSWPKVNSLEERN